MCFAADGEACTIGEFQRTYSTATNHAIARSSLYDWFTPALATILNNLLDHAHKQVTIPHPTAPQFELFREVLINDVTVFRLYWLLDEFPAIHSD
jgi:hypothetical protein